MTKIYGMDVSHHQGNIDWDKVKGEGKVKFVMIRLGHGSNGGTLDREFKDNVKGAERVGIPWGVYFYSYALTVDQVKKEAKYVIDVLKDYSPDYPIAFDMEDADGYKKNNGMPSNAQLVAMCDTFMSMLEDAGYYSILYASRSWLNSQLKSAKLNKYDKWLAEWRDTASYKGNHGMWQYTDKGRVAGISGLVDMNIAYVDYEKVIKPNKKPVVKPKPEYINQYKVKLGDTLGAIASRYGTTVKRIMQLNPSIKNANQIWAGQVLKIPTRKK